MLSHRRLNPLPLLSRLGLAASAALALSQCANGPTPNKHADVVVSVKEQKLAFYNRKGDISREYPISTSKFGLSDKPGTYGTPLGLHQVVAKIGHGAPSGAVFKSRQRTGEILKPDSPGRDPIVSRIMWLRGMEKINKNAYSRCIYIHGTAEERNVGKPVSYGCIRMKSRDVIDLFNRLPVGSRVLVTKTALPAHVPVLPPETEPTKPDPGTQPPIFLSPDQKLTASSSMVADRSKAKPGAVEDELEPQPQNSPSRMSKLVSFFKPKQAEEEPVTEPVALRGETPAPVAESRPKPLPGGGAVLYTAPANSGTPGLVLKSKRHASQGFQAQAAQ